MRVIDLVSTFGKPIYKVKIATPLKFKQKSFRTKIFPFFIANPQGLIIVSTGVATSSLLFRFGSVLEDLTKEAINHRCNKTHCNYLPPEPWHSFSGYKYPGNGLREKKHTNFLP